MATEPAIARLVPILGLDEQPELRTVPFSGLTNSPSYVRSTASDTRSVTAAGVAGYLEQALLPDASVAQMR